MILKVYVSWGLLVISEDFYVRFGINDYPCQSDRMLPATRMVHLSSRISFSGKRRPNYGQIHHFLIGKSHYFNGHKLNSQQLVITRGYINHIHRLSKDYHRLSTGYILQKAIHLVHRTPSRHVFSAKSLPWPGGKDQSHPSLGCLRWKATPQHQGLT